MSHAPPRHRGEHRRRIAPRRALTAAAVSGVLLTAGGAGAQTVAAPDLAGEAPVATRAPAEVSRDAERPSLAEVGDVAEVAADGLEQAAADQIAEDRAQAEKQAAEAEARRIVEDARKDPRGVARDLLAERGWDDAQFACLDQLWVGESDWNYQATNPSSGAYGIPQSLPGSKMAAAGDDWKTNPITQITWGLDYIASRYGSPCEANGFKAGNGFY